MLKLIWLTIKNSPVLLAYLVHDFLLYLKYHENKLFYGWGIHLYVGKFGQGKTCQAVVDTYRLCVKYPQLTVLTNINLKNFPAHTHIIPLGNVEDILNAPENCIVLIDEIGTLFNSRDFIGGKKSVPKSLFQHLSQCRKRKMMIFGTVQRYNLLDKQIRDISATVFSCRCYPAHPFSRAMRAIRYDVDEYEMFMANYMYRPRALEIRYSIQKNQYRQLYDTSALVQGLLELDYLSDEEILRNRGEDVSIFGELSKKGKKAIRNRKRF